VDSVLLATPRLATRKRHLHVDPSRITLHPGERPACNFDERSFSGLRIGLVEPIESAVPVGVQEPGGGPLTCKFGPNSMNGCDWSAQAEGLESM
jgi:hypothetical protein